MDDNEKKCDFPWYVLHTLTGQELKVQKSIDARRKTEEMQAYIGETNVPTEIVTDVRDGKKRSIKRKRFPGYVLVQLNLYDRRREFLEPTWKFLRETNGVLGFIGGDKPEALTAEEVANLVEKVDDVAAKRAKPKVQYNPGETVKVVDGPFMSFLGTVDEVDPEHGKLKISVAIFGRSAPVELEYWQVERFVEEKPAETPAAE